MMIFLPLYFIFFWSLQEKIFSSLILFYFMASTAWLMLFYKAMFSFSHVLLLLLVLEIFMLTTLFLVIMFFANITCSSSFFLSFFTLTVCEASIGLSMLIQLSRKIPDQNLSIQ